MTAVSIVKKDSGEANRDQPIGTGPFKFESWSPNEADGLRPQRQLLRSRHDRCSIRSSSARFPTPRSRSRISPPAASIWSPINSSCPRPRNRWRVRRASSSSSSIPPRSSPMPTSSGGGAARRQAGAAGAGPLPRSERGQGARLRRHRHADQQLHGAVDLGLHRPAELRVRPGEGEERSSPRPGTRMGSRRRSTPSRATRT